MRRRLRLIPRKRSRPHTGTGMRLPRHTGTVMARVITRRTKRRGRWRSRSSCWPSVRLLPVTWGCRTPSRAATRSSHSWSRASKRVPRSRRGSPAPLAAPRCQTVAVQEPQTEHRAAEPGSHAPAADEATELTLMGVSVGIAFAGIGLAFFFWQRNRQLTDSLARQFSGLHKLALEQVPTSTSSTTRRSSSRSSCCLAARSGRASTPG